MEKDLITFKINIMTRRQRSIAVKVIVGIGILFLALVILQFYSINRTLSGGDGVQSVHVRPSTPAMPSK